MTDTITPALIAFLRGQLSSTDLPEEIALDERLWRLMAGLWQRSIQHIARGQVSEWRGVLVLDEADNLKLVNVTEGTKWLVPLQIPRQLAFVGSFHTHPYADGTTGIAFSGADIADAINNRERSCTSSICPRECRMKMPYTTPTWTSAKPTLALYVGRVFEPLWEAYRP